jgi:hypothetical protein
MFNNLKLNKSSNWRDNLTRLLIFFTLTLLFCDAYAKKGPKLSIDLKYSQFTVQQKKSKLQLTCKPLKSRDAANSNWISECNNVAFNLLTQEKYQKILVEKEIKDNPFGNLSFDMAKEAGASFMKKKSIRKSFKTISQ